MLDRVLIVRRRADRTDGRAGTVPSRYPRTHHRQAGRPPDDVPCRRRTGADAGVARAARPGGRDGPAWQPRLGRQLLWRRQGAFRLDFTRVDSRYHYLLFISQAETERILRTAVEKKGVRIERGVELVGPRNTCSP